MLRTIPLLFLGSMLGAGAFGQFASPQVLASGGSSISATGYHVDWTLGEFATATIGNNAHHITQGFHQPYVGTVGLHENAAATDYHIWPNPAQDLLHIGFGAPLTANTTFMLIGLDGRTVLSHTARCGIATAVIPVSDLASGSYLLCIQTPGTITHTQRFIKTL